MLDGDIGADDDFDDLAAYWSGFAHGVGRFLQDTRDFPSRLRDSPSHPQHKEDE